MKHIVHKWVDLNLRKTQVNQLLLVASLSFHDRIKMSTSIKQPNFTHKPVCLSCMLSSKTDFAIIIAQPSYMKTHASHSKLSQCSSTPESQTEYRELTSLGRARMIVRVVMSSATLVPATSFSLSTLLRQPTTYRGPLLAFTITTLQIPRPTLIDDGCHLYHGTTT